MQRPANDSARTLLGSAATVFFFEWRRSLTRPRFAWWVVLTCFPVCIVGLIRLAPGRPPSRELWTLFLFALIPMLVTMLGAFLWATPAISAELERRSWIYLAVRPNGGVAVLLGKYLAAVTWVTSAALIGLALALAVADTGDTRRIGFTIARLALLACPAYAAVYSLIGTLFPKRAMAIAVAYTLLFELVISFAPAMINRFTVQFRLRALLVEWADINIPNRRGFVAMALTGDAPPWHHVLVLAAYTIILLAVAVAVLRASEFSTAEE